jgi:hypothetical protein
VACWTGSLGVNCRADILRWHSNGFKPEPLVDDDLIHSCCDRSVDNDRRLIAAADRHCDVRLHQPDAWELCACRQSGRMRRSNLCGPAVVV